MLKESADSQRLHLRSVFKRTHTVSRKYTAGKVQLCGKGVVASAAVDTLHFFNLYTGEPLKHITLDQDTITSFAVKELGQGSAQEGTEAGWEAAIATKSLQVKLYRVPAVGEPSLVRSWKGHRMPVTVTCFDASGTLLAWSMTDGRVNVADSVRGHLTHTLTGHSQMVLSLKFHPTAERLMLVSSSQDSSLRCWDLVTSRSVVLSGHLGAVSDFCFCGSGLNTLVSVGRDRVVGVWDLRTNTNVAFSPLFEELEAVATLPQGVLGISDPDTVVMGGTTGVLRVFSASSRKVLQERHDEGGLKFSVAQLAFSNAQDGNHLIVVTRDQNLLILEPSTLVRRQQVVGDLDEVVDVSVIGQDCQRMAVATNSADIKIWNVATNDWELLAGHTATVLSIDVSANQSRLCSSGKDSVVRVWDISKTPAKMLCALEGHTDSVNTVAWGGNAFVVSAGKDRTLKLWKLHDKADGTTEAAHVYTCVGHAAEVNCVDVSPNERFIASGSSDKKILLWKLTKPLTAAPTLQLRMTGHKRGIWDVRFSPVDKLLASVSGDRSVRIWSVTSGACLRVLEGHLAATLRVSWMTAGTQLVSSGGDGLVKIWNAVDGECLATLQREGEDVDSTGDDGKLWALDVRRDGEVLVVGSSDSTLCIWHDRTQETAAERLAAEQEERAQRQELDSLVAAGHLARAFALALRLDQRSRGRQIAELLVREGQLQTALKQLTAEETSRLVQLCCDWNRNASLSSLAQACMATLLRIHSLEKLSASPAVRSALNAWLAFSYRHRDRLRGLAVRSHIIDHCLDLVAGAELVEASLLDDDDDNDDNNDEAVSASKNKRLRDEEDGEETKV